MFRMFALYAKKKNKYIYLLQIQHPEYSSYLKGSSQIIFCSIQFALIWRWIRNSIHTEIVLFLAYVGIAYYDFFFLCVFKMRVVSYVYYRGSSHFLTMWKQVHI